MEYDYENINEDAAWEYLEEHIEPLTKITNNMSNMSMHDAAIVTVALISIVGIVKKRIEKEKSGA